MDEVAHLGTLVLQQDPMLVIVVKAGFQNSRQKHLGLFAGLHSELAHSLLLYSTGHTRPALIHGGRRQRVKHQLRVTGGWTDTLCPISGSTAAPSCLIPF